MENMQLILASNLRRIREERRLSLDKVSELTGVSKSMLGQIERGESNPTLQTVWKIANGLRVSLTDLTEVPRSETVVISKEDISTIVSDNGLFRVYPVFPFDGRLDLRFWPLSSRKELILVPKPTTRELWNMFWSLRERSLLWQDQKSNVLKAGRPSSSARIAPIPIIIQVMA